MIGDPPSYAGLLHVRETCAFPAVAATAVGAPGTVAGVTEFDADDDRLVPTPFVAVIVKEYVSPFVSPVTVIGLPVPVAVYVSVMSMTV